MTPKRLYPEGAENLTIYIPEPRVTNKARQHAVREALRRFDERHERDGPSCPKRPGRPHRFSGYPREAARCWFCNQRRDG